MFWEPTFLESTMYWLGGDYGLWGTFSLLFLFYYHNRLQYVCVAAADDANDDDVHMLVKLESETIGLVG